MSVDWKSPTTWLVVLSIVVVLVVLASTVTMSWALPEWAKDPCPKCESGKMKWLPGQDSGSTGEALFICKSCGHKEHRGGWASEIAMETWDAKR
jgi:hypothetical protein